MAGPFPGMDPYLEFEGSWPDFHNALITEIRNALGTTLPSSYIARMEQRIEVGTPDSSQEYRPDVLLGRFPDQPSMPTGRATTAATATIEPRLVEIPDPDPDKVRITWVEVRALPDLELVTVIEVLSPINKSRQGRRFYLERRNKLHASEVNLVEIDLLLGDAPLPMKERIAAGGYYAIVARGVRLPVAEVYSWGVKDPLPRLPVPLRETDSDVFIDLGALANRVYDLGRYMLTSRRGIPLPDAATLSPEDRTWAESVGKAS